MRDVGSKDPSFGKSGKDEAPSSSVGFEVTEIEEHSQEWLCYKKAA